MAGAWAIRTAPTAAVRATATTRFTSGFVPFNPNDRRQFAREFREWSGDAEQLRRELSAAGVNPKDLDDVIRDLKQFGDERGYEDLKGLEKLQAAALERLQQFEFNLRKKAEPSQDVARALRVRRSAGRLPHGDRGVLPAAGEEQEIDGENANDQRRARGASQRFRIV